MGTVKMDTLATPDTYTKYKLHFMVIRCDNMHVFDGTTKLGCIHAVRARKLKDKGDGIERAYYLYEWSRELYQKDGSGQYCRIGKIELNVYDAAYFIPNMEIGQIPSSEPNPAQLNAEFRNKIYELAFGDNAINNGYTDEEVLEKIEHYVSQFPLFREYLETIQANLDTEHPSYAEDHDLYDRCINRLDEFSAAESVKEMKELIDNEK